MISVLNYIFKEFNEKNLENLQIIPWSSPIVCFGNLKKAKIATLGINPSDKEFINNDGIELKDDNRRFHTLNSFGLENWVDVDSKHLKEINISCEEYFSRNPYDKWFKRLDYIISGTSKSYYFPSYEACHLDLVPWATRLKWSSLNLNEQNKLLKNSSPILGSILRESNIHVLILNGQSVVTNLEKITSKVFYKNEVSEWNLKRKNSNDVKGYSYNGIIEEIGGISLDKKILVLGYNHNIQSSFGVTKEVQKSIRNWIAKQLNRAF
ncbi:hypothetical protein [Maribacter sp. 1_2014MBL_MicDiv]|uniref:hypothetical protein n=1 Tax=Maribacter sp. 1_2014MBL_MicDiv TaxID=1644130 RepID=UPI0008F46A65|nr:hypothetical protein [Maribacter sp. 1_2014MBL_MicDiv]APA64254.1 hypothetical protein YQ22_07925 [Maribacter sp. 1_2014MBL_MicDiv]